MEWRKLIEQRITAAIVVPLVNLASFFEERGCKDLVVVRICKEIGLSALA